MQPPLWPQILLQVILIALNAYFAATEIAVISLNEAVLRRQAEDGDKKAALLLKITEQPTGFLSTIQIGITLAGFLGAAFGADNLAGRLSQWLITEYHLTAAAAEAVHTLSVILITLILSYFTLIFGELVPKRVAMKKSDAVARFTCRVVAFLAAVMRPVIWLLTVSTNGVLRLLHIDPNEEDDEVSEEGIRMMVDIGEEKGAIQAGEKEMIENIFEFDNMTAEDVMVHRTDMEMLWVDDTPEEIEATIESTGLSRCMRRTPTTSSACSAPGSGSSIPAGRSPSRCGSCSGRPTLCPSRCAPTSSSGICRAGRFTWPSSLTSTAAPPAW